MYKGGGAVQSIMIRLLDLVNLCNKILYKIIHSNSYYLCRLSISAVYHSLVHNTKSGEVGIKRRSVVSGCR